LRIRLACSASLETPVKVATVIFESTLLSLVVFFGVASFVVHGIASLCANLAAYFAHFFPEITIVVPVLDPVTGRIRQRQLIPLPKSPDHQVIDPNQPPPPAARL